MFKYAEKLVIVLLLTMLALVPLQAAQAKSPASGLALAGQVIFGGNYTVKSGDTLDGDLVVFGGSVTVEKDARVNGALVLLGGSVTVDGDVDKDVVVIGGAVKLKEAAHVYGNLVTVGAPVDRDAGAKVDGDVINNAQRPPIAISPLPSPVVDIGNFNPLWNALSVFAQSIALGVLALLVALFLPEQTRRVGETAVKQPLVAGGLGILSILLFVMAIVALALFSILIITMVVTIPLIFLLSLALAAGAVFGLIALGTELGIRLVGMFHATWALPLTAALGTFILNLVANSINFVPCVGWIMPALVGLLGLGAVFMTRYGMRPAIVMATPAPVESNPPIQSS